MSQLAVAHREKEPVNGIIPMKGAAESMRSKLHRFLQREAGIFPLALPVACDAECGPVVTCLGFNLHGLVRHLDRAGNVPDLHVRAAAIDH